MSNGGPDPQVVFSILAIGIALLIGFTVLDGVGTQAVDEESGSLVNDKVLLDGNTYVQVRDKAAKGINPTANDSMGYAVALTGAPDSYVETESSIDVPTDQNFTVSTWARVNPTGNAENMTMTALSVQGEAVLSYNGSTGNWTGYYYSDKTRDSYRVDVDAPNQPGNLTRVELWANGTHVAIYRNKTRGQIVALNDNTVDASIGASNWNGTVEETSVDGVPVTDAQRSELVDDPVSPRPGSDHRARLMYDAGSGGTVAVYWASGDATISNGSWVLGFTGEVLKRADILGNGDYRWKPQGPKIKPLSGGEIDGAPVVWVEYTRKEAAYQAVEGIANGLELASLLLIVLAAGLVLTAVRAYNG